MPAWHTDPLTGAPISEVERWPLMIYWQDEHGIWREKQVGWNVRTEPIEPSGRHSDAQREC